MYDPAGMRTDRVLNEFPIFGHEEIDLHSLKNIYPRGSLDAWEYLQVVIQLKRKLYFIPIF